MRLRDKYKFIFVLRYGGIPLLEGPWDPGPLGPAPR